MFFSRASLVTLALSAIGAKAVYFVPVNTTVTQCDTISLTVKGLPPFTVSVWPGCDDDADADEPYADYHTNSTTINWKVNVATGKTVQFEVEDAHGNVDYTDDYTVKASDDKTCVGVSPSFSTPTTGTSSGAPSTPTTQSAEAPGNVGGGLYPTTTYSAGSTPSTGPIGGLGGAMSNFSPRVEMAGLVVLGSTLASLLF